MIMEPAIHDLTRELDSPVPARPPLPATELDVELEVVDDLLLDPWFWKSEDEFAQIEDDPTAKIIEIKIGKLDSVYGTGFDDSRWAF
jgi:hypothetical protein